jgi:SnoaL-like domain
MTCQDLTDHEAITDQLYRYCRAMDRIDHELGYAVWHDDGTADYGPDIFQGTARGFVDHVCAQHAQTLAHSHQMSNIVIELDGDKAASESCVTANLRINREGRLMQITVWSRYIDTWSKRAGRWAIDHRFTINDFDEQREVAPLRPTTRGSRDRNDPSYGVLKK